MRNKYVIWSLVVTLLFSTLFLAAGPLNFTFAAGGQNLTPGKTITSSGQSQTYSPDNVKDGNQDTYWESTNNAWPQWIQVDLGSLTAIDQLVLKLPSGWETRTQTLAVQGSTNGTTFTDIVASANYVFNPPVNGNSVTVNFAAVSTRYVRLSFTANTGWPAAQLAELEIYGSASATPAPTATPVPAGTYEAEAAALSGGAKVNTDHTGYSGAGFVDGYLNQGPATTFTVNVTAAGTRNVTLKYANASGSDKTLSIYVNGTKIRQTVLPNLANWDTWSTKTESLVLNAGSNTIAYKYDSGDTGNVNLDLIIAAEGVNATPTPSPSATPAVTPSPTPVSTPTPVVTPSPTPVPTPTVTPSPTPVPTATVSPGGNVAAGKAISASSSTQNFIAGNANDNNTATYWEGSSNPSTLTLDLGANHNITSVVLKLNPATEWGTRTQNIQVLGHNQSTTAFSNLVSAQAYTFNPATGNTVTIPVTATVKRLQLNITSNTGAPAGQIAEFQVYGTPAPNPDLIITGLSWTPASPVETSALTLNATVKNNGSAAAAATTVNFYLNNELAGSAPVAALAAGASATVSVSAGTRTAATYPLSATVDESNLIIEQNDSNNSYTSPTALIVAPVASSDLTGTATWSPGNPVANTNVAFTVNLKNQGTIASAGGAHGITLVLKNSAGATVQTFTGSYSGVLAAGASVNVSIPGSWTAVNGNYTVTTTVAVDANEVATKQANNVNTANLVVYALRGASVPYSRYDTEDATRGGAAALRTAPDFDQALTASEASGQSYIALPSNGAYAQWTVRAGQGGAGVTMRFTMPDSADGMGLTGALDVYVNGSKAKTIPLTSYYAWQYFSGDQPGDAPSAGRPLFRFDEVHWKLDTPLQPGDTIRIQKNNGDSLEYGVDFLEIEPVPAAISRPANTVSVTDYGAVAGDGQDDLAAFNSAVTAAVAGGKTLYIPAGTFNLSSMWVIGSVSNMINNFTVTGAGYWHTNLQFTNPNAAGGGISLRILGKLDFSNVYMNSNLRSRYNQNAIYKGFMDNFGNNSIIHDVWVEHFECGMWVGDYAHTPAIYANNLLVENSRIRNNLADGINYSQGTSNSTIRNTNVRNNGDDGLAVWPSNTFGAPDGVNNTFSYNTIENNWRAGGIAFFGGSGHKADHNYIIDTVGGSGIRLNTTFPGAHFNNNTGILFSDTTIINSGTSRDLYDGERGAIDLEASSDPIKNVTFTNIDIINTQRDAIQFGYGGGFSNIVFNNININGTGLDGVTSSRFSGAHKGAAIYTYTGNGSATFNNLTTSNIAYPSLYYIQTGFGLLIQ
ncbi:discoidin domain-containing protein [Paenibacillus sp. MMS20-IR301]|uniref:discoidin domain-containing protein n=1 Tax=Paenibacillus sp. MMS20-IR301 TaxID=2895946 RepID=UPI0028E63604|nr:discoidin domain-containing protein [Paenibacillus sp. MMS20-IR301]WNS45355.1 discoidin domain-containing protein [Paenibacillus sp. MMS20-IR301]